MKNMHWFVTMLPKWFPEKIQKCDRNLSRIWAGCMFFLLSHEHYLKEAVQIGLFDPSTSVLEPSDRSTHSEDEITPVLPPQRLLLPPIHTLDELLGRAPNSFSPATLFT
jgi:hypothetical protein